MLPSAFMSIHGKKTRGIGSAFAKLTINNPATAENNSDKTKANP
jgi:hypothetical protein